jgi:hypothetical protein
MIEYKIETYCNPLFDCYVPLWRKDKKFLFIKYKTKWKTFKKLTKNGFFWSEDKAEKFLKENNIDLKVQERRHKLDKLK